MPNPKQNLYKAHVTLDRDDHEKLQQYFGPTIGISKAIRIAVRRFLSDHEALSRAIIDSAPIDSATQAPATQASKPSKELPNDVQG